MNYLDSRRFHWDRLVDLFGGYGAGLTRWQTARLCWHHLWRLIHA